MRSFSHNENRLRDVAAHAWASLPDGRHVLEGYRLVKTPKMVIVVDEPQAERPETTYSIVAFPKPDDFKGFRDGAIVGPYPGVSYPGYYNPSGIGTLEIQRWTQRHQLSYAQAHQSTKVYPNPGKKKMREYAGWLGLCLREAVAIAQERGKDFHLAKTLLKHEGLKLALGTLEKDGYSLCSTPFLDFKKLSGPRHSP